MPTDHQPIPPTLEHTVYLLRVWYEPGDATPVWRASLHLSGSAVRKHFAVPGTLLEYLGALLDPEHSTGPTTP